MNGEGRGAVDLGLGLRQPFDDGLEFRVRLFQRHVRFQTTHDGQVMREAITITGPIIKRRPDLDALAGELETARHDAYDQVRSPIQTNRLSDDASIAAEPALPQPVTQDGNVGLPW